MSARVVTIAAYLVVLAAACTLEWFGRRKAPGAIATLSGTLGAIRSHPAGRAVLWALWGFVAWHFLAR